MKSKFKIMIVLLVSCILIPINASAKYKADSIGECKGYIGKEIKKHSKSIEIEVKNYNEEELFNIFKLSGIPVIVNDNNESYDYDFYNLDSVVFTTKRSIDKNNKNTKVIIQPEYRESKEETKRVLELVRGIILENSYINEFTNAEKYRWIYSYIIDNVKYDYTLKNTTAYEALTEGKTICGGYSTLFYAMARELNLPVRIVYGFAGEYHAWNIVKLDDKWYYVDCTFGDNTELSENYLFKGRCSLSSHRLKEEFERVFKVSDEDYIGVNLEHTNTTSNKNSINYTKEIITNQVGGEQ